MKYTIMRQGHSNAGGDYGDEVETVVEADNPAEALRIFKESVDLSPLTFYVLEET